MKKNIYTKFQALPISLKLTFIVIFTVLEVSITIWGAIQIAKGARFHQLNSLHLKYNDKFTQEIIFFRVTADEDTERLKRAVLLVREQPISCLNEINFLDQILMNAIGTSHALELCYKDLEDTNKVLLEIERFNRKEITKPQLFKSLDDARDNFVENSTQFEAPITKTVSFIINTMIPFILLVSICNIIFIFYISRDISNSINRVAAAFKSLATEEDYRFPKGGGREISELTEAAMVFKNKGEKLKDAQAKLVETARLASLGQMATGIAHEINNPLAIIMLSINLLKKKIEKGGPSEDYINKTIVDIEETVKRISKIIHGLKTLSRDTTNTITDETTFEEIFSDTLSLCTERFKSHDIKLDVDIKAEAGRSKFCCDRVQISQILINMLGNSFDAIEKLDEKWVKVDLTEEEGFFTLKIIDSGKEISEEIKEKMFTPFFTSKDIGKGTGLGLSISKTLIEKHGGSLEIDTECPNTCFVITIPKTLAKEDPTSGHIPNS